MKNLRPLLALPFVCLLGCGGGPVGDTSNIEIRALNMALATKAQQLKVPFLDTYSILLDHGKPVIFFFMPDGEHLSDLGYRRWADAVLTPSIQAYKSTCAGMVGDSITRRVFVVQLADGTPGTWQDLLGIPAYNLGVDGETSDQTLKRIDDIIKPDIDVYFVMIGNNDLHDGVSITQIVANVESLVKGLRDRTGKRVVIQAVMPLYW